MIIDTLRNILPANGRTGLRARAFALAMLFAAVLAVAFALQSGSPVQAQSTLPLVAGLHHPSDNGGRDLCTGVTLKWDAPTSTDFDGYFVNYRLAGTSGNLGSLTITNNTATSVFVPLPESQTQSRRFELDVGTYQGTDKGLTVGQDVRVPPCLPAVTGLRQSSNNDGHDRCEEIAVVWNDPGRKNFTGYKVVVTHPDETTTTQTADNLATQANTGEIVWVRVPSATESQTYKIDVHAYLEPILITDQNLSGQ